MSNMMNVFVTYQEGGLPHETMIEIPALSTDEAFISMIHSYIGESANITNIINMSLVNPKKSAESEKRSDDRPQRRSDSRPSFG
jgi:hypothetical protein